MMRLELQKVNMPPENHPPVFAQIYSCLKRSMKVVQTIYEKKEI